VYAIGLLYNTGKAETLTLINPGRSSHGECEGTKITKKKERGRLVFDV
jgi:hypothetical protein